MLKKLLRISPFFVVILMAWACSRTPKQPSAILKGRITVDPKVDNSGDYSGIGVTVIFKKDTASNADTLFHAVTDTAGYFNGTAHFEQRGQYPMLITRNDQTIATSSVILGNKDTVNIQGQLPDFVETEKIKSRENTAFATFQNVQNNYRRVVKYLNAGALPRDTIPALIKTWSKLFWSVHQDYPNTMASERSAVITLNLLQGFNDNMVLQKYDSLGAKSPARIESINALTSAATDIKGLQGTVQYLDSLSQNTSMPKYAMALAKSKIDLLYDSTKINRARDALTVFRQKYDKKFKDAANWSKYVQYDLDNLAPGMKMPEFKVWTEKGDTISNKTLKGKPYILEITGLGNSLYRSQYANMEAIALVYKKFGLQIVTIPLDQSQDMIDTFYKNRGGAQWPIAAAGAYKSSDMLKMLNVEYVPTRFVVGADGDIVKKYITTNLDQIIAGLKIAFHKQQQEKS